MGDSGKPGTGRTKKRQARAAAAKPSPAETAAARPEAAVEEPAAPVGFTARDGAGETKPGGKREAKPANKRAAVLAGLVAAVAVVAVAGYLTRPAWLPKTTVGKPAAVAAKTTAKPAVAEPAGKPEAPVAPPPAAAPAVKAAAADPLVKEREQLRAELNRLIARLDGVEKSMDTAKKMIRATAPVDEKLGSPSLQQLSERVGELEKREAMLKELAGRVDKMEKSAAEGANVAATGGAPAVVLAVSGLNDAITRGEPFDKHLETLAVIGGGDPNIKATLSLLAKGAATGIPTLGQLRDRFDKLAGDIVRASKARDDAGWMGRAVDRVSSLITWRRVGDDGKGDAVDRIVARAEARLKAGDLTGAVKAVENLAADKKAAAAAEAWLADAKGRLIAERAVASLHVHAVSLLSAAKP